MINATVTLYPYAKFLLASGEISWGTTELFFTGTPSPLTFHNYNAADTFDIVPAATSITTSGEVPAWKCHAAYDTTTQKVALSIVGGIPIYAKGGTYNSPVMIVLGRLYGGAMGRFAHISIPFSAIDYLAVGKAGIISFPNDIIGYF